MESIALKRREFKLPPYILLLAPGVIFMLVMYMHPFVASFARSLLDRDGSITLEHYRKTWELYRRDIGFTFLLTTFNAMVSGALAVLLSVYLRLREGPVAKFLGTIYKLPIFIPFVVVAQMMNSFLAPHGLLNVALAQLRIIDLQRPLQLFNFYGLSFGFNWKMIPFAILIIHGGFQMIDNSYIEAARSSGAGIFRVILRILIPMNKSTILVAMVLVYSQIISCFSFPYMLIGGRSPTTITVDIAHRVNYFRDYGVANALGVCSYILVLISASYYLKSKIAEAK